ncbi:MAG: hypothetical protein QM703_05235 [Gemmatales bacterium]
MKWTVLWQPSAEQQLTNLWTNAKNKQSITFASNQIDALLRTQPQALGESRSGLERIFFYPPLSVIYEVIPDDSKVIVTYVYMPENESTT